jgi:hypothetical protein
MTTAQVLSVRTTAMPRGSRIAGNLFARAMNWLLTPSQTRVLSRAEEAADVRAFAYRVQATDPGFAADLFAAAARHESLGE